jgi:hypothetical protein
VFVISGNHEYYNTRGRDPPYNMEEVDDAICCICAEVGHHIHKLLLLLLLMMMMMLLMMLMMMMMMMMMLMMMMMMMMMAEESRGMTQWVSVRAAPLAGLLPPHVGVDV